MGEIRIVRKILKFIDSWGCTNERKHQIIDSWETVDVNIQKKEIATMATIPFSVPLFTNSGC